MAKEHKSTTKKEIKKLLSFIGKDRNLPIEKVYQEIAYNDEPKIYSFTAELKNTAEFTDGFSVDKFAGGCSLSKEKALLKTLGEVLERYSLSIYRKKNFNWNNYNNLEGEKIDPQNFVFFSQKYFHAKPKFKSYVNKNDELNWTKGFSLTQKEEILIPAQLIFVPYRFEQKEPVIRFPITTGAACYSSLKGAILRGLLEVIERDAFMIYYLNKLSPNIINIENCSDELLKKIAFSIKKYNLELYVLDISTDVPVYSILTIIIDKTGLGPAISLGMKSDLSLKNAILGAIDEAFQSRPWIRTILLKKKLKIKKEIQKRKYLYNLEERGVFWSKIQMINKIKIFLSGKKISIENLSLKKTKNLDTLLKWFKKENIEVIYKDVTTSNIKKEKIHIVKVLVPTFQPLYLDERFPYWKGKRLREVPPKLGFNSLKTVNQFPHPFL